MQINCRRAVLQPYFPPSFSYTSYIVVGGQLDIFFRLKDEEIIKCFTLTSQIMSHVCQCPVLKNVFFS